MKFSLLVLSPPEASSAQSAWHFAQALLDEGHDLYRVFFFSDGVYCGDHFRQAHQSSPDWVSRWSKLSADHKLDMVLCVSSALRRGVLDEKESERRQLQAPNIAPGFTLSGLGQWVDATLQSDRTITFGPDRS